MRGRLEDECRIAGDVMENAPSNSKNFSFVFWMIALGLLASWAGGTDLVTRWHALVFGARLCDILILASGAVLLAAGIWRIWRRAGRRTSSLAAAAGAAVFSATLLIGVWSGAIPCSGPS